MYNLITFIEAQKKQGVTDSEIESKLKKAGWNYEQINYVMNKYAGKRTGMIEIKMPEIFKKKPAVQMPKNRIQVGGPMTQPGNRSFGGYRK